MRPPLRFTVVPVYNLPYYAVQRLPGHVGELRPVAAFQSRRSQMLAVRSSPLRRSPRPPSGRCVAQGAAPRDVCEVPITAPRHACQAFCFITHRHNALCFDHSFLSQGLFSYRLTHHSAHTLLHPTRFAPFVLSPLCRVSEGCQISARLRTRADPHAPSLRTRPTAPRQCGQLSDSC
jgi:hypothetical protein